MAGRKPMKQQSRRVSGKGNASGDSAAAMMLRVAGGDATPPRRRTTAVPNRPPSTHTAPPPSTDPTVLVASVVSCSVIEGLTPQSIGVSYWFDSSGVDESGEVPVRLVGRRVEPSSDAEDPPGSADAFDVVHVVRDVPSGVGQLCATIRVTGTAPGEWEVDAYPPHASPVRVRARTGFQPFIGEIAPGASLGAWGLLVFLGALAGVSLFMFLVSRAQLPVAPIGLLAVLACVIGVVGAKVYYLAQAPGRGSWTSPGGMCIQGFVIAALAVMAAGSWILGQPLLALMDLATPALLLGMAIGRLGCWRGGCCTGRLTSGRWAVWCSDRRLGGRRIPVQMMEAAVAGVLALGTLLLLEVDPRPAGAVLAAGMGGYVLARQLLFRFRSVPRRTSAGTSLASLVSGVALAAALIVLVAAAR